MIHGRVRGQELRDIPPERLPIWGQRWFSYCRARRASEFETRTFQFTASGILQMGPALSSPSQFYSTIGDAELQENEGPSPDPTDLAHSPSPPVQPVQTYATEPIPSGPSTSQVAPHPSLHRYHGDHIPTMSQGPPNTLYYPYPVHRLRQRQNTVGPSGAMLVPYAESGFLPTRQRVPRTRRGFVPRDYHDSYWHTNSPSTSTQPRAGPSRESHIASGQLQEFLLPDTTHWQFSVGPSQSSTQTPQLDSSLHHPYHLHPHNSTGIYLTPPPSSSLGFTVPLPQQNANSSWRTTEPNVPVIPTTLPLQNPTADQWQSVSGSVTVTVPLQVTGSSSYLDEEFRHLFTDPSGQPSPLEVPLDVFAQPPADESILLSDTIHEDGYSG